MGSAAPSFSTCSWWSIDVVRYSLRSLAVLVKVLLFWGTLTDGVVANSGSRVWKPCCWCRGDGAHSVRGGEGDARRVEAGVAWAFRRGLFGG